MNEIFSSEEMKRFEQEQFLKRSSYSFMKKAGYEIFQFIEDKFKNPTAGFLHERVRTYF